MRAENQWTYITEGSISSVFPASGQEGTLVTLRGATLLGGGSSAASVLLSGASAFVDAQNNSVIVVRAAHGTGNGSVVVVSDTGSVVTRSDAWQYLDLGVVASVVPSSGVAGTRVVISGDRLRGWREPGCVCAARGCGEQPHCERD